MAVIDDVFCLDALVLYKRETVSVVRLEWSETMSTYNTPVTIVRDRMTKYVMKSGNIL